ncbi:MAG: hypothetical protein MUF49_13515 [Oculatellaceae cyanobacterium Prado106]|jgi:Rho-binding antiterminator|nr:hypothetical protein [Oculatellaceae cyanobacterium Prado106]
MSDYIPVSCDFHDELEALAVLHRPCQITYRKEAGQFVEVQGEIVDIYASNHADFCKLKDGTVIRLDQIVAVDDTPVSYISAN